jgi:lipopolysaccharide export system protein LptA
VQGFSQNRDKPVQIEATSLEVREKDKVATFSGSVRVVQGDTTMRCRSLVVFYEHGDSTNGVKTANPGPGGKQSVRRLEAKGGVIVNQKDQTATGDSAIFDMRTNSVTLIGNVTVTQGPNVMRGDRLVVDLTNGISKVEAGKPGDPRPVRVLIQPSSGKDGKDDHRRPAGPARPPLQLN